MYIIDLGIYDFYINVHIFIKIISLIFFMLQTEVTQAEIFVSNNVL